MSKDFIDARRENLVNLRVLDFTWTESTSVTTEYIPHQCGHQKKIAARQTRYVPSSCVFVGDCSGKFYADEFKSKLSK